MNGVEDLPADALLPKMERREAIGKVGRLSFGLKLTYAGGQLVDLVIASMLNIFILFYVTAACGMPGALAGLALSLGLIVDAISDPLIGSVSDGYRSRFGRRVPFMLVAILPLVVLFNLIFALPVGWSNTALFIWLSFLSISLRIALSVFHLPYQALGAELSDDYDERSSIAAWRWGIGILGTFAVIALSYGVYLAGPNGVANRTAYQPLTLTLTVLVVAGAVMAIFAGLATRDRQIERAAPEGALHHRLAAELREMFRSRTFLIIFSSAMLLNIAQGVGQALGLHMAIFFWHLTSAQIPLIGVGAVAGLMLGAPLAARLAKHFEKRILLLIGMGGLAACQALPVPLQMVGLLPTANGLLYLLVIIAILNGAMFTVSAVGFMTVIPDAADEHEDLFGTRREGMYFAGWAFASKASHGAGLLISGIALQLIDFPANVSEHSADAAAAVSAGQVFWLGLAGGPLPGVIALVGTSIALLYRVDRNEHARILGNLAARRVPSA